MLSQAPPPTDNSRLGAGAAAVATAAGHELADFPHRELLFGLTTTGTNKTSVRKRKISLVRAKLEHERFCTIIKQSKVLCVESLLFCYLFRIYYGLQYTQYYTFTSYSKLQ